MLERPTKRNLASEIGLRENRSRRAAKTGAGAKAEESKARAGRWQTRSGRKGRRAHVSKDNLQLGQQGGRGGVQSLESVTKTDALPPPSMVHPESRVLETGLETRPTAVG